MKVYIKVFSCSRTHKEDIIKVDNIRVARGTTKGKLFLVLAK